MSLEDQYVEIPSVRLYRDSEGNGPGKIVESGVYLCTYHKPRAVAPIHIEHLGWVKCYPNGIVKLSDPPIHVCEASEFVI